MSSGFEVGSGGRVRGVLMAGVCVAAVWVEVAISRVEPVWGDEIVIAGINQAGQGEGLDDDGVKGVGVDESDLEDPRGSGTLEDVETDEPVGGINETRSGSGLPAPNERSGESEQDSPLSVGNDDGRSGDEGGEEQVSEPFPRSLLKDVTGDGAVTYLGFGDSITYGVGDGSRPGEMSSSLPRTDGSMGYTRRLSQLLGIPAINAGVPGEQLDGEGIRRLPQVVAASGADIVGIFEGINDARQQLSVDNYQRLIQKAVNMVRALGRTPLLFTHVNPCCDHLLPNGSPDAYSQAVRRVAEVNEVAVADVFRAWSLLCPPGVVCSLFNLPEGLHPNTKGYSVIAQVASAAILGTNIFDAEGAKQFLEATGLTEAELLGEIAIK